MTKFRLKHLTCAALILAGANVSAQPLQVGSTVQLSGLTFSVFDLTPEDGIEPGFALVGGSSAYHLFAKDSDANILIDEAGHSNTAITPLTEIAAAGRSVAAWSGATIAGTSVEIEIGALAGGASANSTTVWEFNLAPNTALQITGKLNVSNFRVDRYWNTMGGTAKINSLATLGDEQSSTNYREFSIWDDGDTRTLNLTWSLFNGEDRTVAGALSMDIQNSVYTNVSAVPEPSTYLMLATGSLLTAGALRRRRITQA